MITISIENIQCVHGEDFLGPDEFYYVAMLGRGVASGSETEPESPIPLRARCQLTHTSRSRPIKLKDGESARPGSLDAVLFPNAAIPAHAESDDNATHIEGPLYFFDLDQEHEQHSPQTQVTNGIVVGHVAGAAAVVMGIMIGGTAGVVMALLMLVGSMVAATYTLKHLLLVVDRDDYLGGYRLSVPIAGEEREEITLELTGSEGIEADDGRKYDRTSGTVLYRVKVRVERVSD